MDNLENEEWKTILDYPNYMVSNHGRVYNTKHNRLLTPFDKFGYLHVTLYSGGESKAAKVHRLVALAFLKRRNGLNEVNHLDGDKTNNSTWNLEWSTRSQNMLHAFQHGLKEPTNRRPVRIIETGEVFPSLTECAHAIGGSPSNIHHCISRKIKSHRGLTFEYA